MGPRGRSQAWPVGTFTGMARLRLGAAGLIPVLVLARRGLPGHPPAHALALGLTLAAAVAASALVQLRRPASRAVAAASAVVDVAVAGGLALAHGFDPAGHDLFFALTLPAQAEAVVVLGLPGGLGAWAVTSGLVMALELSEGGGVGLAWAASGLLVVLVVSGLTRGLSRERHRFRSLLEAVPDAVLAVDPEGRIALANRAAEEIFGYAREELIGRAVETLLPEGLRDAHVRDRETYATFPRRRPMGIGLEPAGRRKDGSVFPAEIGLSPVRVGRESLVLAIVRDITERKRMMDALRASEGRFRTVVESSGEAIVGADREGRIVLVNAAAERMFGYPRAELLGREVEVLFPEEDREAHGRPRAAGGSLDAVARALDGGGELRARRRDGTLVPCECEVRLVDIPEGRLTLAFLRDLTERKRAEEERRRLLHRLVSAQEEERARIASDVHDDPIQKMSAVGMRLAALRSRIGHPELVPSLQQLEETVATSIESLRHLLFELRPPALDREGLAAALRHYLVEAASEGGFSYQVEDRLVEEPSAEVRAIAYRVAQEALTNVRKHARARHVQVLLESREGGLRVRVRDDGVGFAPAEDGGAPPGHLGLPSMRERVELAGGWWRVESARGAGTTVEFWLPARREQEAPSAGGSGPLGSAGALGPAPGDRGHPAPPGPQTGSPEPSGRVPG